VEDKRFLNDRQNWTEMTSIGTAKNDNSGTRPMRLRFGIILIALMLLANGCQGSMTGIVVDAETGKPIEGAVVLVEWTKTSGLGLKSTSSYKVVEVLTDKEGRFSVSGVFNPFVDEPDLTIYKKGYVAWNNQIIFPDYRNREGFEWKDGYVFELEKFKASYSYNDHVSFISSVADPSRASKKKITFKKHYLWELKEASRERDEIQKRGGKK
jgi:hypothetical protein